MALLPSTLPWCTSLYLIIQNSTMAQLHCSLLYLTLPWLYFIQLLSTFLYHGSTRLYLTLNYPTMALLDSTMALLHTTLFYYGHYISLLHFKLLYHVSTSLYITLP